MKVITTVSTTLILLFCLVLPLGGCAGALIAAEAAPGLMGGVMGGMQSSSLSISDADTAKYVLPVQTTAEIFVRDVRDTATANGFSVTSASSSPMPGGTMTLITLSKQHRSGLFTNTFISLMITLAPDGRTINFNSSVHGSKDVTQGAVISDFQKKLEEKFAS